MRSWASAMMAFWSAASARTSDWRPASVSAARAGERARKSAALRSALAGVHLAADADLIAFLLGPVEAEGRVRPGCQFSRPRRPIRLELKGQAVAGFHVLEAPAPSS